MMPNVSHHIPEEMIQAYVSGAMPHAFSVVVAAHLSLCDDCRAAAEALETVGGLALEGLSPAPGEAGDVARLRARTLAALDTLPAQDPEVRARPPYPAAVMAELDGRPPRWKSLGAGIRQTLLSYGPEGSVRLLSIPGGKAVPDHGHNGLEMTLVLQGAFSDHTGRYGPGDVQVAETDIEHVPTAEPGMDCICLAATDAPLRFAALVPRMLQGVFRI